MASIGAVREKLLAASVILSLACALPALAQQATGTATDKPQVAGTTGITGTTGIKGGERFAETGEDTVKALQDAETELRSTLDAYNMLVTKPTKDPKSDYKKLLKNLDRAKKKLALVKPKVDTMNTESESYFSVWQGQVAQIADNDLRSRGEERIGSTRKDYDGILTGMREAAGTLDPFLKDLSDQINFLGSDLRPDALASLKGNAEKLNNTGKTLFEQTGSTVAKSNAFFAPLKEK